MHFPHIIKNSIMDIELADYSFPIATFVFDFIGSTLINTREMTISVIVMNS